jgi:hypothetical protein
MKRAGVTFVEIFVAVAIVVIFAALLLPAFNKSFTKGLFQEHDVVCIKTFERSNGKYSSDLIAVFERPDQSVVTVECNVGLYAQVVEGKQYDISYEKFNYPAYGTDGILKTAIKVYKAEAD